MLEFVISIVAIPRCTCDLRCPGTAKLGSCDSTPSDLGRGTGRSATLWNVKCVELCLELTAHSEFIVLSTFWNTQLKYY